MPPYEPKADEDITLGVLGGVSGLVDPEDPFWFPVHQSYINLSARGGHGFGELLAVTSPAVIIFAKAYIETLAKHAGDQTADIMERIRFRRKRRTREIRVEIDDRAAAVVALAEDLPDDARLALLDLDVTADELRGKLLRWDVATGAWRPPEVLEPE